MFGLSEAQMDLVNELLVKPLARSGTRFWVFGSRARGDHRPFSDLDILFESNDPQAGLIGRVKEDLVESDLPFKVDLVDVKDLLEAYKPAALRERVPWPG